MHVLNTISGGILAVLLLLSTGVRPGIQVSQSGQQASQLPTVSPSQSNISRNWAGYTATNGTFTGVSGTWTVPRVSGNGNLGADATWVGVGGVNTQDLIQAGTQAIVDPYGQVSYSAFYEGLPDASQPLNLSIRPGDSVSVSLTKGINHSWNIVVKDNTTGDNSSVNVAYNSSLSSAEWIEEAPSGQRRTMPLDNFGTVGISNARAIENGRTVTPAQADATPMTMTMGGNVALAEASVLSSNGSSFTVTRTNQNISGQTIPDRGYADSGRIPFLLRRHLHFFEY